MYDELINEILRKAKMEGLLVFVGVPLDHEPPHPAFLDDICEAPRVLQLLGPDFL